jgi:hypothetical protein
MLRDGGLPGHLSPSNSWAPTRGLGSDGLCEIRVPAAFRGIDHADFYRRGWRDAEACREPADMHGYPAALKLAYIAGGLDAAAR